MGGEEEEEVVVKSLRLLMDSSRVDSTQGKVERSSVLCYGLA